MKSAERTHHNYEDYLEMQDSSDIWKFLNEFYCINT